jgi:hypothetical protein
METWMGSPCGYATSREADTGNGGCGFQDIKKTKGIFGETSGVLHNN